MDAALMLLSFRGRTEKELARRLSEKGYAHETIARVCERLKDLKYIDDRQFAVLWLGSFSGPRCRSPWVLKRELKRKGIDASLADELVDEARGEDDLFEAACELVRQRIKRSGMSDMSKMKARLQNLLLRRGFDYEFIRKVLAEAMPRDTVAEGRE
ncbi:MAG: RecX family transcriptional regulator [Candidatus Aureabacteria bacterium]|nr:RecX family transcriptional regulator [Candidatus Auribacterota bacterium]